MEQGKKEGKKERRKEGKEERKTSSGIWACVYEAAMRELESE